MSIFDKLKQSEPQKPDNTFSFTALPESAAQLTALPEGDLSTPFKAAALTVCALCAAAADEAVGVEMLNALRGPRPLSVMEAQFLRDRLRGKHYVPFSYFKGAVPGNDYTPDQPFTVTVEENPYSYQNEGYATLYLHSGGADSPRPVTLRQKGDGQWCLWEHSGLLPDIRKPKSENPWA